MTSPTTTEATTEATPSNITQATDWYAVFLYPRQEKKVVTYHKVICWVTVALPPETNGEPTTHTISGLYQPEGGMALQNPEEEPGFVGYYHNEDLTHAFRSYSSVVSESEGNVPRLEILTTDSRVLLGILKGE